MVKWKCTVCPVCGAPCHNRLSEKKLSYKDFYLKIGKYRREFTPDQRLRGRRRIQTQRKRDWRRKEARKKKDSRYKKRRPTS